MLEVIWVIGSIWCIWAGIRHLQSEGFAWTFLGGYKKSEDGSYPGNWRIWVGLFGVGIGIIAVVVGLSDLGAL